MSRQGEPIEIRRKRLRFRSQHRGTREMDILLGGFTDANLDAFSDDELDQLEALLNEADDDLHTWIMDRTPIPEGVSSPVLNSFRDSVRRRRRGGGSSH